MSGFGLKDINITYKNPVTALDLIENPFEFHPDEDRIYALCMHKYTYGFWDLAKNEISNCPYLLMNWVAHTRTIPDI